MWTHRRFTWQVTCPDHNMIQVWATQVKPVLAKLMQDTPQFYRDGWMSGTFLGALHFQVTISDRDQWWVNRRARLLVDELRKKTDLPIQLMTQDKVKLPPHPNRGKYRLRRRKKAESA
jgi:hypothetical protein